MKSLSHHSDIWLTNPIHQLSLFYFDPVAFGLLRGHLPVTVPVQDLLSEPVINVTFTTAPAPGKTEHDPYLGCFAWCYLFYLVLSSWKQRE